MNGMFGGNQQADERFPSKIWKKNIYRTLMMLGFFVAASAIGFFFRHFGFPDTNIVIVYLLAVLVTSWLARSFIFGFVASLLATFAFNYLFAEPLLAFSVNDPNYIVTLIIMTVIALITSTLTSHAQRNAKEALEKEAETKAIYNLTNHLTDAEDIHAIAALAASAISECFLCNAACLCFDENNVPEKWPFRIISAQGNTPIDQAAMDTLGFIACYMGVLVVGTLLLTLTAGCSLRCLV